MNTVFGPVPSRRLGRSLGIDVVPPKTCSYDCIYCESGRTTHLTVKRRPFVTVEKVLRDLERYFREHPTGADTLTFSSAGEPTLYEPLGELMRSIKKRFSSLPLVVLTNGSLLWDPAVRRDLAGADRVVPSVDAVSESAFIAVNRPHPALSNTLVMEGLKAFRKDYPGRLHIEVMLVAGVNDNREEIEKIAGFLTRDVQPDRIELNTVVRPPAAPGTRGLSGPEMEGVLRYFPIGTTEIIGRFEAGCVGEESDDAEARVLEVIARRPCTVVELAAALGVEEARLIQALQRLQNDKRLEKYVYNDLEYFRSRCGKDSA